MSHGEPGMLDFRGDRFDVGAVDDSMAKASLIYSPTMPVSFLMGARSAPALRLEFVKKSPSISFDGRGARERQV